jgi:Protein of unknown function (DUF4239)
MNLAVAALLLVGSAGIAVAGMYLVRRRAPAGGFFTDSDRAAAVFGVLGTAFAVLLAFVIFLSFESWDSARTHSQHEADAVQELFATTHFLSPPVREQLQAELICYGRAVIHQEWPAMRRERSSAVVDQSVDRFEMSIYEFEPVEEQDKIALSHWLEHDAVRQEARRGRIAEAVPFVPGPLWAILVLGGAITVAFILAFADSGERLLVQALMIGAVTVLFVSSMLLVVFLDHPYENTYGSIKPDAMTRTVESVKAEQRASGQRLPLPCNEKGKGAGPS